MLNETLGSKYDNSVDSFRRRSSFCRSTTFCCCLRDSSPICTSLRRARPKPSNFLRCRYHPLFRRTPSWPCFSVGFCSTFTSPAKCSCLSRHVRHLDRTCCHCSRARTAEPSGKDGGHATGAVGPNLWNSSPTDLRRMTSCGQGRQNRGSSVRDCSPTFGTLEQCNLQFTHGPRRFHRAYTSVTKLHALTGILEPHESHFLSSEGAV